MSGSGFVDSFQTYTSWETEAVKHPFRCSLHITESCWVIMAFLISLGSWSEIVMTQSTFSVSTFVDAKQLKVQESVHCLHYQLQELDNQPPHCLQYLLQESDIQHYLLQESDIHLPHYLLQSKLNQIHHLVHPWHQVASAGVQLTVAIAVVTTSDSGSVEGTGTEVKMHAPQGYLHGVPDRNCPH